MPVTVSSSAIDGLYAHLIRTEVDVHVGLHSFHIVGLPDKAVEEAKERISSALKNSGFKPPHGFNKRTVINLAPADRKKQGTLYDLPMALGFILASKQGTFSLARTLVAGELGLDGMIRPVHGILSMSLFAKQHGYKRLIIPFENSLEAKLVPDIEVCALQTLNQLLRFLEHGEQPPTTQIAPAEKHCSPQQNSDAVDLAFIQGQQRAKRAIEIAAAGGHNVLMQGPPGAGKTLLAKAMAGILPSMSFEEKLETTQIASVKGELDPANPLVEERPFRAPHHSSSESAILGGGPHLQPGEISMAHRGVLFLDEFPEFHRDILESLRQPLTERSMRISRARGTIAYPAAFVLVAAANPCPCGYRNDTGRECVCNASQIMKYQRKLSGPIADRIDIHVWVPSQSYSVLSSNAVSESSGEVRMRVEAARAIQTKRFDGLQTKTNAEMSIPLIKKHCGLDGNGEKIIEMAMNQSAISARGYHNLLKVARTIADLTNSEFIEPSHVQEALSYMRKEFIS